MVIFPCGRKNASTEDEEREDQNAGNEIMRGENKLMLFVHLEQANDFRGGGAYSAISKSVPTPFVFQIFLYRNKIPMYSRYCGGSNWAIQGNNTRNTSIASSNGSVFARSRVRSDFDTVGMVLFFRLSGTVRRFLTRLSEILCVVATRTLPTVEMPESGEIPYLPTGGRTADFHLSIGDCQDKAYCEMTA
jgi:hypothetical protein